MAKNNEVKEPDFEDEFFEEDVEVSVIEKKSLLTKTKEKVSAIGDMTVKDVVKKTFKIGAVIGGAALVVVGGIKLFGNNDEYDIEFEEGDTVEIKDNDGNVVEVVIDETAEI